MHVSFNIYSFHENCTYLHTHIWLLLNDDTHSDHYAHTIYIRSKTQTLKNTKYLSFCKWNFWWTQSINRFKIYIYIWSFLKGTPYQNPILIVYNLNPCGFESLVAFKLSYLNIITFQIFKLCNCIWYEINNNFFL